MKRLNRTKKLIADFEGGYAKGWHMSVPEYFHNELDIKYSERKKDKKAYFIWTQGPYFSFSAGQIFYDNSIAYRLPWHEAIRDIRLACQILEASPCKLNDSGQFVEGELVLRIYYKSINGEFLKNIDTINTTQTDFVNFLKTGHLPEQANKNEAKDETG